MDVLSDPRFTLVLMGSAVLLYCFLRWKGLT